MRVTTARRGFFAYIFIQSWVFRSGGRVLKTVTGLDLCKLPHHGSRANVTTALIEAIDASRYLVSTDGMTFGHPDDAALARLMRSSASPARIYCNYASGRTQGWVRRAESVGAKIILPKDGATSMRVEVA